MPPADSTTFSYTGSLQSWTVPDYVDLIRLKVEGAGGGGSQANDNITGKQDDGTDKGGGAGGYAQGDKSVTPSETLYVTVGRGGYADTVAAAWPTGGSVYDTGKAESGGGGGHSDVRRGGNTWGDRIIVAGGGGGGGGAVAASDGDSDTDASSGADGGGKAGQAGDANDTSSGGQNSSGGVGGGSSDRFGEDATGEDDEQSSAEAWATGGAGGGGNNGGTAGGWTADPDPGDTASDADAAGGGGGTGYVGGVFNTTSTLGGGAVGGNGDTTSPTDGDHGSVTIEYAEQTDDLTTSLDAENDAIELSWTPASDADSQDLYRATASGSQVGDYTKIADLSASTSTYTDIPTTRDRYYYRVQNVNSFDNRLSTETDIYLPSGPRVYDGSNFTKQQVKYYDGSSWQRGILKQWDGSSWVRK